MATTFSDLGSVGGMKKLDDYLSTHSYITGDRASKDDITVHAALSQPPSEKFISVRRWYHHMEALLRISAGVTIEGSSSVEAVASPPVADEKSAAADEDDDDVDLFGGETEEKKAAEEHAATIKASSKKQSGKSSVLLDVKPWDDGTDMKKLEEAVRGIRMEGLLWGAWMIKYCTELQHLISLFEQHLTIKIASQTEVDSSFQIPFNGLFQVTAKLVPSVYGIEKLQIMLTIVDDLVSVNTLMEDQLTAKPVNAYVQSCDIVSFNKISSQPRRKRRHRKKKFASHLLTILENGKDDTDLFREAAYNNNGHIGDDVVLRMRESWAGELRQRTLGCADDAAIVKPAEANNSVSEVNNPVKRLETAESLDWKHLMAEDLVVQKSPLRYFMDEMSCGNSLCSTTTIGNEKERERVYDTIFQLPWRCEMLINVGVFVCFDSFLSLLTIMPTRIVMLLWRILTTRELTRPTAAELSDFGCFIILASGVSLLERTDISLIYHMIRGQGTIKLYVVYNVLEIFDKLCQSFGGDVLQTLFNSAEVLASCTRENMTSCTGRYFSDLALAVVASIVHSFILLAQAITLSTCIVAHNNALLPMLVSNNFAEIKSNVFKRFSKDNIHSIVYYDSIERFHISAFVLFVLAQNILEAEGPWFESFIFNALMVFFCEIAIDTIKHSFIAKFNDIKPIVYSEFLEDLCKQTLNIQTDLKKNLTFVPLAPACVVIRVLTPVYAVLLPHHSFPWKLFWVLLLVFMTYVMLASLKVIIHMGLQKYGKWYVNRCEKRRHHLHVD